MVDALGRKTPNALALSSIDGTEHIDYATLAKRVDALSGQLCRLGVGTDEFVGLCLPRTTEMLTALMAIHHCGGALVPLDPDYPQDRLTFIIDDSGMSALITDDSLVEKLPEVNLPVLKLNGSRHESSGAIKAPRVQPGAAAYLIYTSGSTGVPKGVVVSHHALRTYVHASSQLYGFTAADRVLQFTSINFDVAIHEIFGPISVGACIVPRDREMMVSPQVFMDKVALLGITKLSLATAYFHELARAVMLGQCTLPPCLRFITFAGERAKPELVAGWFERIGDRIRLINGYGPTESTVVSIAAVLEKELDLSSREVPIGRPLSGEYTYILNQSLTLSPAGIPGELFIGGACIARGYHRRPSLTAQRFLPDPYGKEPGARIYRTGDLARIRNDRQVDYLGRTDRQVKLRGFRIELGEVEAALTRHSEVSEAIVVSRMTRSGEPQLVAYLLTGADQKSDSGRWRAHLRNILPEYMLPAAFVELDSIPLNANGKIDYDALPEPEWDGNPEVTLAGTPTEKQVAAFYAELLDLQAVDVLESFFDLGGHSLLAARLIARIREHFDIDMPMRTIFNTPTVSGISRLIEDAVGQDRSSTIPRLAPEQRPAQIPASFAQTRLWFLDHLEGSGGLYNVPTSLSLFGSLDIESLEQSLAQVVHRHESLRTRFVDNQGIAYQVIDEHPIIELNLFDLSGLSKARSAAQTRQLTHGAVNFHFNLAEGPLIYISLLRLNPHCHRLLLTLHHIITDGWSMAVFVQELIEGYVENLTATRKARRPAPLQYADYTLWQRRWLKGDLKKREHQYWVEKLEGIPDVLELPTDRPRPAQQRYRGSMVQFTIPRHHLNALEKITRDQDASLFMGLVALIDTLLYKYSHQEDIVIGTPVANRGQTELEGIIGLFVNTLALRVSLAENPTFIDLLQRVQATTLEAYAHQTVPFEQLLDILEVRRDLSHAPVFQVMLVLQNLPETKEEVPGLTIKETISKSSPLNST